MYKIMIIEDDDVIAHQIKKYLQSWDYEVELATRFNMIIDDFSIIYPDLILLDLSLPFKNGFYWYL